MRGDTYQVGSPQVIMLRVRSSVVSGYCSRMHHTGDEVNIPRPGFVRECQRFNRGTTRMDLEALLIPGSMPATAEWLGFSVDRAGIGLSER